MRKIKKKIKKMLKHLFFNFLTVNKILYYKIINKYI